MVESEEKTEQNNFAAESGMAARFKERAVVGDDSVAAAAPVTREAAGADGHPAQGEERTGKITAKKVAEYAKRCIFLAAGLVIMSFGVGLSIKASLGTSPISSVPTVLYYITDLSVGTTTIIFNVLIVLLQIALLRKKFRPVQLLQIPVCIAFGLLCDLSLLCLDGVAPAEYWEQWLICIAGIALVAAGVSFEVAAGVITLAGEGLALALCKLFPKIKFGYMKVMCDCSFVIIAAALSLIFMGKLQGVREGTVAAAIFVGLLAKQLNKITVPLANRIFATVKKEESPQNTQSDNLAQKQN